MAQRTSWIFRYQYWIFSLFCKRPAPTPETNLDRIHSMVGNLQEELLGVIYNKKYDNLSQAEIVGVLEFLKWNIINRS